MMKNFVLRIILFFAIVFFLDFGFGILMDYMSQNANSGDTKMLHSLCMDSNYDVLIMGSSRAHHHYDDRLLSDSLDLTVYNMGVDGNGIVLMNGLWKLLSQRYTPKLIIYDVEPAFDLMVYKEDDANRRYLSKLKPFFHIPCVDSIFHLVSPMEEIMNHSVFFRYNTEFFNVIKNYVFHSQVPRFGYVPIQGMMTDGEKRPIITESIEPDYLKISFLRNLVDDVRSKGAQIVFIASPKFRVSSSEVYQPLREICDEYKVSFWDFYNDTTFQKSDYFKEPMHLNKEGAEVFSYYIANKIREYYANTSPI